MLLTLSSRSVRNAIFTNESAQVLYKTTHPYQVGLGTTTLYKVRPSDDPVDMRDQFDAIGQIEWHVIGSSMLRLNGSNLASHNFLPSHGILKRKRTFTGPDGCLYRWDMLYEGTVVLSRDGEVRTEVARYHRGSLGIVGPKQKPRLAIDPDAAHMLDLIVLTFVYMEKHRMDMDGESKGPLLMFLSWVDTPLYEQEWDNIIGTSTLVVMQSELDDRNAQPRIKTIEMLDIDDSPDPPDCIFHWLTPM